MASGVFGTSGNMRASMVISPFPFAFTTLVELLAIETVRTR